MRKFPKTLQLAMSIEMHQQLTEKLETLPRDQTIQDLIRDLIDMGLCEVARREAIQSTDHLD